MKKIFSPIVLFFPASLILLFFVSCGPAVLEEIATPAPSNTFEVLSSPILDTPTPACLAEEWPCPSDSLTLTAEMGPTLDAMMTGASDSLTMTAEMAPPLDGDSLTLTAVMRSTLAAIPSSTSPPWATIIPSVGDLGWGSVYGIISDGVTNLPLEGATVTCVHSSYTSPYPCNGITTTNSDGIYSFTGVFFHDTDRITLVVEMPGYTPLRFEQDFFTRAEFHADLGLFPATDGSNSNPVPHVYSSSVFGRCSGLRRPKWLPGRLRHSLLDSIPSLVPCMHSSSVFGRCSDLRRPEWLPGRLRHDLCYSNTDTILTNVNAGNFAILCRKQ